MAGEGVAPIIPVWAVFIYQAATSGQHWFMFGTAICIIAITILDQIYA